ncbi:FecR family protein [Mucilaginibacter boryungensis]|uniref:FecR domain-containing protein n=1 Tax=Mucilaginibacter boryungensis TaxID=768480 RepID=A0ABR9XN25_9SPHI|nr:FecR family protein [Mucilaginibacter boryungensis]MBE9668762.1 FecR domain-containing protein [Mucilaginibacter boryungensis]
MENSQLKEIFSRYLENRCTAAEVESLISYFNTDSKAYLRQLITHELETPEFEGNDAHLHILSDKVLDRLRHVIDKDQVVVQVRKQKSLWPRIAVAATVLLALSVSVYFITRKNEVAPPRLVAKHVMQHDIAPGGNKAVLILSNGKQINLTNAQNGQLAKEANAVINKTADGKVIYKSDHNAAVEEVTYNTLKTPRGGKFDLTLADGTRVWLNAASSITYPSAFTGNSRQVEITGEAYFEVVHNAAKPFRVRVAGQTIEDLGTQFNVNAYSDEPNIKATLLEGSIRLTNKSSDLTLKPGQQAIVQPNQTIKLDENADTEEAVAWHKGMFEFHDASIETVMRQLARWYDVDVSYEGKIPQRQFSGKIYRNTSALKVSDILSYKQIHFRLEGRKIIVTP